VTGVTVPGVYEGKAYFQLPGQDKSEAQSINLVVEAKAQPEVDTVPSDLRLDLDLVNCGGWFGIDCGLAKWFVDPKAFRKDELVEFRNNQPADVSVQNR
jgi:hypothetical protein